MRHRTATLLVTCPERKGLVARLASFVSENDGNIIQADHHTDFEAGVFLSRIEWELDGFALKRDEIEPAFRGIGRSMEADWLLRFSDEPQRIAIFVSKQDHCLLDLLWRVKAGELRAQVVAVVSNHPDLACVAEQFDVPFEHIPVTPESKSDAEDRELSLVNQLRVDLIVLAKYMQILSPRFLKATSPIINIHHSFLPAFRGEKPYHRAHERGVKLIGATAHYVTAELDEGPIIVQDVAAVSHRDNVDDLIRRGRDVERLALSRAARLHLENRVMVYGNRTVVFD